MILLALRSLSFYWRTHLGVLAGTLLASAVLTGSLLVGDSVDYSLRSFATMRLGGIHFAVDTRRQYFHQALATELAEQIDADVAAALLLRGMAIRPKNENRGRVQINKVEVLGIDAEFWNFTQDGTSELGPNETAINLKLATALGVEEGDEISLRFAKPSRVSRDAPLSVRGEARSMRGRYTVVKIVPDENLGRFSLSPGQIPPYNAFVSRLWLQERVSLSEQVNLLIIGDGASQQELTLALRAAWKPEHIGLRVRQHPSGVVQLESDRVFLDAETARVALEIPGAKGALAYLINSVSKGDKSTPYSFAVAGPVPGDMRDDEIVINRWLADQIGAGVGDRVEIVYAELLASNDFEDRTRTFTVHSIREMDDLVAEEELMPTFPGLSDVESCSDWDVGMPMDEEILLDEANEQYWKQYHQTPKCLVTLAAGQQMWSNRFGNLTAVRFQGDAEKAAAVHESLMVGIDPARAGLVLLPVREQANKAVAEAMDFGGLFIGMSFFLIVAALMLTGLLFAFGVQQRATEMGTLLALGFRPSTLRILMLGEGFVIALIGTAAGAGCGVLYTRALIYGLSQYWQGAVANAAIRYHSTTGTLVLGAVIGLVCAMVAMSLAHWRQARRPARELLSMDFTQEPPAHEEKTPGKRGLMLSLSGIGLAVAVVVYAQVADVTEIMIPFFAAGSLLLMSGIGLCRHALITLNSVGRSERLTLGTLALQNIARRQGRSLTVVGLLACGCFLVFSVAAMQEDLYAHAGQRSSGTGGFALLAESTFPLLEDPLDALDMPDVSGTAIKVRDGDDASCLNLNHAQTPRILGVNVEAIASRGAFTNESDDGAIWRLLHLELEDGAIPALVGDANTAMWTLKKRTGIEKGDVLIYRDESGTEVNVKLVGALPMRLSIFQGTILISDKAFTKLFPSEAGYRMFLIDAPAGKERQIAADLGDKFDRFGLDAIPTVQRLLEFYAVETTYLAMFLVLGGLGVALGSVGMGIVVLRNLLERRSEMAMLRAIGFDRPPIYQILFTEYTVLLIAGLAVGSIAAAVSTVPALLATDSNIDMSIQIRLALLVLLTSGSCMALAIFGGYRKSDYSVLQGE